MTLDTRTIFVMLLAGTVLMALTLSVGLRRDRGAAVGKWNLGLGMIATAWLLIAVRDRLPELIGFALADSFMLAGLCMHVAALLEFERRRVPSALLAAPGPLLFAAIVPTLGHYAAFTLLVSASFAAALLAIAAVALRGGSDAGPVRWMMAPFYAAAAAMLLARAGRIWLHPAAHPDVFAGDLLQSVTFLAQFAATLVGSFSFLVMQRERAEAAMRRLAMIDPLTELLNRRAFAAFAERTLARARRVNQPCAVLMIDLDHFKRVNDDFGHLAGDRVLAGFGALLKRCLRPQDLAGRHGGEEFCVLLADIVPEHALEVAERIRRAAAESPLGGVPRPVTASVGVAQVLPRAGGSLDTALARADEALYAAKQNGRNRVIALPAGPRETFTSPTEMRLASS
jgi:diguanylate cyclase (GGDEF)-like protein